ncbi:PaaI family thioesterase [Novosphingobium album (ex Hu et al. 2023)]|uniref:PaaI family thioesterase n=1 Tax=Novosphingobium album (ex Hu et al. 2023) TaxID=2930093 RepID=A0ABT0AXS1_9SPHN|nr:PaaI family thioesterase [Novosphingobium album (ex Hu et al. 2023)]MCJ2177626.1 PaaI family thioesterase [Novosphingobium album (ex Hu et al. 2023)]
MANFAALEQDGWQRLPVVRYSAALGPTWMRLGEHGLEVALLAEEHLANDNLGIVHGGAMMTFADMALGCGVGHALRKGEPLSDPAHSRFVTAQLQVHFVSAGQVGELIVCRPEVVRATSSMVFMRGLIEAAGRTVASVDGIFKVLGPDRR